MQGYVGTKYVMAEPCGDNYKIVHEDGFESWSPKEIFESAYRSNGNFNFGDALFLLKRCCRLARKGWNGKGMYIELQRPDEHSKMTLPYIYMKTADDNFVPWLASQTDMLAEDWEVI